MLDCTIFSGETLFDLSDLRTCFETKLWLYLHKKKWLGTWDLSHIFGQFPKAQGDLFNYLVSSDQHSKNPKKCSLILF